MFDRVVMDVIRVPFKIPFVANGVLPETTLPNPALTFANSTSGKSFAARNASRKSRLDGVPARREIGVARWQGPKAMQVVGKNDDCIERERSSRLCHRKCMTQQFDMLRQQPVPAFKQSHREKEGSAGNECTGIAGHAVIVSNFRGWRDTLRFSRPTWKRPTGAARPAPYSRLPDRRSVRKIAAAAR